MEQLGSTKKIYRAGSLIYTSAGLITLFCFLLGGDFAWALKDRAIGPASILLFKKFCNSDLLYSLILIAFPNFTNIFLCPIISYISDRHRGKLGRRIPFLIFTTPFVVAGAWGLGFTPMLGKLLFELCGGALSINTASMIIFGIFWVILDFGTTLAGSLSGALVNDVVPKEMLGRFFGMFRAISLLAGMIFNYYLMGMVETYFFYIFLGIGAVYGAGLLILCTKVKEGEYPPPPQEENCGKGQMLATLVSATKTYMRQSFANPYYRMVIFVLTLSILTSTPFNMFSILYAKELNVSMALFGKINAVTYLISFGLSFLLGFIADKFHPLRATVAAQALYLTSMVLGLCFVNDAQSFVIVLFIHNVLSGCCFTVEASLAQRLFPTGLFAQFNSAFAMVQAIARILLGIAIGALLEHFSKQYHIVFIVGIAVTAGAVAGLWMVYRKFIAYGGDDGYTPPDPGK